MSDKNPLCGWCVVENKFSRVSRCANGNSTSDRWIRADNTTTSSGRCIINVITPSQYVMDDPQIVRLSALLQSSKHILSETFKEHFRHLTAQTMYVHTPTSYYICVPCVLSCIIPLLDVILSSNSVHGQQESVSNLSFIHTVSLSVTLLTADLENDRVLCFERRTLT